jgi:D-alanyl-D-alanine carboxypeptidase (penicillin-binding protein 5/6)
MRSGSAGMALSVASVVTAAAMIGMVAASPGAPPARARDIGLTSAQVRSAGQRASATLGHPQPQSKEDVGGDDLASHGLVVNYPPHARQLPGVPASAYVIADAGTGDVLAAKDAHGLYPPASTLKVLTAVTMLPRLDPNAMVLTTKRAASVEPNIVGLIAGHRYKVSDLFRALLMISANDAAVALVQASGSFGKGMALVSAEAHHLQAYDVVARYPNGLPARGQVVSAYDLALIARQALSMPAFMKYDSTLTATFPVKRHDKVPMLNQNYLLTQYRGGIGGKIGWTTQAEATYIGLARRHGVTLIVTILHATPLTEITSAERLLNWGFAMSGKVRPVGVLVPPLSAAPAGSTAQAREAGAAGTSRSSASVRDSGGSYPLGAGVAAGVFVLLLGSLAWLRRRLRASSADGREG